MDQQQTNLANVRQALNNGMRLTVLGIVNICNTIDGRKYISMLRKEGMDIIGEPTTNGNKKRFNTYYLRK